MKDYLIFQIKIDLVRLDMNQLTNIMLFLNIFCTKTHYVIILYELFLKYLAILYLITLILHKFCHTILHLN